MAEYGYSSDGRGSDDTVLCKVYKPRQESAGSCEKPIARTRASRPDQLKLIEHYLLNDDDVTLPYDDSLISSYENYLLQ